MPFHISRRTAVAAALAVFSGDTTHFGMSRMQNTPGDSESREASSGLKLAWESPWKLTRDHAYSLILDAGEATFALVSWQKEVMIPVDHTPSEMRDSQTKDSDTYDFLVLASFDDAFGSHALTIDENTDIVRFYVHWELDSDFIMEIGFYAPLLEFADAWNEARQTITLNDVAVFEGYDESRILQPVANIINAAPIDPTPIANEAEHTYLGDAWSIHDTLKSSSDAAHAEYRNGHDPFGDEILTATQPYVDVWTEVLPIAEELSPPGPAFQPLHNALIGCATTFAEAAALFNTLGEYEDMARSAKNSEFGRKWDDADDHLRTLGDLLATFERP